jgi:hypothetical protein
MVGSYPSAKRELRGLTTPIEATFAIVGPYATLHEQNSMLEDE